VARLARAEILGILEQPYIHAAHAVGLDRARLLTRHLLPNALTPVIVAAALGVGNAIMLEAGLSFLGLGIPAPAPSWGNMIAGGRDALVNAPWIATVPGLAVVSAVVACNLLGDGLRDALDPRTRAA
jgi:peptide/nickel transport system permease protein